MSDSGEYEEEELTLVDLARAGEIEAFAEVLQTPEGVEAVVNAKDEYSQANVLHMAAANGHAELVRLILEKLPAAAGQQLARAPNSSGNTPMHWAALTGSLASVEMLVGAGADPLAKNAAGLDPIYQAENAGQDEISAYLCGVADLGDFEKDEPENEPESRPDVNGESSNSTTA